MTYDNVPDISPLPFALDVQDSVVLQCNIGFSQDLSSIRFMIVKSSNKEILISETNESFVEDS